MSFLNEKENDLSGRVKVVVVIVMLVNKINLCFFYLILIENSFL